MAQRFPSCTFVCLVVATIFEATMDMKVHEGILHWNFFTGKVCIVMDQSGVAHRISKFRNGIVFSRDLHSGESDDSPRPARGEMVKLRKYAYAPGRDDSVIVDCTILASPACGRAAPD
jgi:hypothetical protein